MVSFEDWNPVVKYKGDSFKIVMGEDSQFFEGCRNYVLPLARLAGEARQLIAINAPQKQRKNTIKFLNEVETELKLKHSRTRETNDLTIIELNKEWTSTPLRYSFLTMLLKIGCTYPATDPNSTPQIALRHITHLGPINDWEVNVYYRNNSKVWSRIQNNIVYIKEYGLQSLDKYSWNEVKPKYEKDIGFINSVFSGKNNQFEFKGEVDTL